MGRSRAVPHLSDEDFSLSRFKKKRTTSTTENSGQTFTGQGPSEKKHASYKCNYCNKDISGKIRIKCVTCPDFDLCVECFSVGAEVTPHKSNHPYRVMDNLSLPLLCSDWSADEEILLLEGIEMYGLGNWTEVSGHVGTKNKTQCISHYNIIYMNSPCFPLPDLSHVMGKSKGELLAMSKEHDEVKKGPEPGETTPREEPASCWATRAEELRKECPADRSSGIDAGFAMDSGNGNASINAVKKASIMTKESRDSYEVEGGRCVGEKKPRTSGDEGPSVTELNGYNFKRQEFEIEYDNDAEQLLADMEFRDTDTNGERELKLQVLHIYNKRLDERKRRKEFILERNLLFPGTSEKRLAPEEREICRRYKVFMRFQSKEEHEELLKSVIEEHFILKRIQDLQEARAGGCRTSDEARRYIEKKRKEERDGNVAHRAKEGVQDGEGAKISLNPKPEIAILESSDSSPSTARDLFSSIDVWDISGFPGEELLSESEKRLCNEIRMLPAHYLKIMQKLSVEVLSGNITEKSDASSHLANFNVNPAKLDRIYDMLVEKGIPDT